MSTSLYLPESFAERDVGVLHDLVEAHSFGVMIVPGEGGAPAVAHLPFLLDRGRGPFGALRAHVARANPVRRAIEAGAPALVVFNGPHGYVSPGWYASRDDVPTWNYAVVHAHGAPRPLPEDALWTLLGDLSAVHERAEPAPWRPDELSEEVRAELLPAILGFEIAITRLEGKLKLSQNRRPEDRAGTLRGLSARGTPDDLALSALMERTPGRGR